MKNRFLSGIRAMSMPLIICALMPLSVMAQETIKYIDENQEEAEISAGDVHKIPISCSLDKEWYFVEEDSECNKLNILDEKEVNIILSDNASLKAGNIDIGSEASLTIYSQSIGNEMGELTSNAHSSGSTAISNEDGAGSITINGGKIKAFCEGSDCNSYTTGIDVPNITINGGIIEAFGKDLGIKTTNLEINGGIITAEGIDGIECTNDCSVNNAVIFASSIDIDEDDIQNAIVFDNSDSEPNSKFFGSEVTPTNPFEIAASPKTLYIPHNKTLTIKEDITLTNYGEISNWGTINVNEGGKIKNHKDIYNAGYIKVEDEEQIENIADAKVQVYVNYYKYDEEDNSYVSIGMSEWKEWKKEFKVRDDVEGVMHWNAEWDIYNSIVNNSSIVKAGDDFTMKLNPVSFKSITLYSITYRLNGGNIEGYTNNEDGNVVILISENEFIEYLTPKKDGFVFGGWYSDANFESDEIGSYQIGDKNFMRWDGNFIKPTKNEDFYAKWLPMYKATYYLDGGEYLFSRSSPEYEIISQDEEKIVVSFAQGEMPPQFVLSKENSLHDGEWYINKELGNVFDFGGTPPTSDIELWPKWEEAEVISGITYHLNGGECPEDMGFGDCWEDVDLGYKLVVSSYVEGTPQTLPGGDVIKREGYLLVGWFEYNETCNPSNEEGCGEQITTISATDAGDKEFWAKWTKGKVVYDVCLQDNEKLDNYIDVGGQFVNTTITVNGVEKGGLLIEDLSVQDLDYGPNNVKIQVDGGQEFELIIFRPIPFDQMVITSWGNTMTVIAPPENNGGYTFGEKFTWYYNGEEIGEGQSYYAGNGETLKEGGGYDIEFTIIGWPWETLNTCPETTPATKPMQKNAKVVFGDACPSSYSCEAYSVTGKRIKGKGNQIFIIKGNK